MSGGNPIRAVQQVLSRNTAEERALMWSVKEGKIKDKNVVDIAVTSSSDVNIFDRLRQEEAKKKMQFSTKFDSWRSDKFFEVQGLEKPYNALPVEVLADPHIKTPQRSLSVSSSSSSSSSSSTPKKKKRKRAASLSSTSSSSTAAKKKKKRKKRKKRARDAKATTACAPFSAKKKKKKVKNKREGRESKKKKKRKIEVQKQAAKKTEQRCREKALLKEIEDRRKEQKSEGATKVSNKNLRVKKGRLQVFYRISSGSGHQEVAYRSSAVGKLPTWTTSS
eukprot:GEMP01043951.1.p1 GENE.GEMP01043951.1~~GEMP01043951.1.p1  ORF type:complete len:278 (+),score=85.31 GEMP01043951.1:72-905(+)